MHRMPRNNRNRFVAIGCGILLCYLYYTTWISRPVPESVRLARFMNAVEQSSSLTQAKPSSFDWSRVDYEHPLRDLLQVPSGRFAHLPTVQYKFPAQASKETQRREQRREQVRHTFQRDWNAYRRFAWMKDALMPVSGSYRDQFSGWAATLVDSLDTLWIMGLRAEFDEAVAAVAEIDFGNSTSDRVNTFETNIRYLGGLLSAYDLSERPVLLAKARELGDLLYGAFNTDNRMPVDFINFERAKSGKGLMVEESVVSASPGTLSLEMTRLSQVTGDPKYYTAMSGVMNLFFRNQNKTNIPGLWPTMVSMSEEDVTTGTAFTLAGCADSLYEYLPKMHGLLQGTEPIYDTMSRGFLTAANEHMLFRPMLPDEDDILIAGNAIALEQGQTRLDPETEHLACYLGGAFALGGRLLNRPEDIDIGARLTRGCMYAYHSMPSGVGPERWNMVTCKSRSECRWNEDVWDEEKTKRPEWKEHLPKGFTTVKDPRYILRPEAIESVFILYRITGRQEFEDAAWDMFLAVSAATQTQYASGSVPDVTRPIDASKNEDYMEVDVLEHGTIAVADLTTELLAGRDTQILLLGVFTT
ncbi:glycoside hydrolase family 47 protein [Seiridium cupressi]